MLDPRPARADLTDRECVALIGGLLGSLVSLTADIETVKRAIRWWADSESAWVAIETFSKAAQNAVARR